MGAPAFGQNRSRDFGLSVTDRQDRCGLFLDLTMAESSINSNHWKYKSKWAFTPFKVVIYQSIHSSYLIWRAFWRTFSNFPAFKTSSKFGFLVKQFVTFVISFSGWFFKKGFNPLPDLLNTGFTIIEISLFYGGKHFGAKICRFLTISDKIA